ncbi:MAG: hypothetical protein V4671_12825 [Armatimonadota bacterium]
MGGFRSGRHGDGRTAENRLRVDIRHIRKNDWLKPGVHGKLSWFQRRLGEKIPTGDIRYVVFGDHETGRADALVLQFRSRSNGGEWQEIRQDVPIEWTACNYGGGRPWLRCPKCDRRC